MLDINEVKNKLNDIIEKYREDINFLGIFGSVAKSTCNEQSDLDILYDIENTDVFCEFLDDIEDNFKGVEVDFVPITSVLSEKREEVVNYFLEGSIKLYESERIYDYIKDERLLTRYKRFFN